MPRVILLTSNVASVKVSQIQWLKILYMPYLFLLERDASGLLDLV